MKKISKSTKLNCAFCQGKGIQPGAERLSCIVCKGNGHFIVKQPYNICKECGGRGRKKGANLYCFLCHGKGFIEENRHSPMTESSVLKMIEKNKKRKDKFNKQKRASKPIRKKKGKKSIEPKERKVPSRTAGRGSSISSRLQHQLKSRILDSAPKQNREEIGTKVEVKKERKSPPASPCEASRAGFFKKFLATFKILPGLRRIYSHS